MARSEHQTLRVVVGTEFGPRSSVWRVWTVRDDVYVAPRPMAGEIKTSLHASGQWRHAFTASARSSFVPEGDRAFYKWRRPTEFTSGATLALRIVVPADELTTGGGERLWIVGHHEPMTSVWERHIAHVHQLDRDARPDLDDPPEGGEDARVVAWLTPDEEGAASVLDISAI